MTSPEATLGAQVYYSLNSSTVLAPDPALLYDGRVINVTKSTIVRAVACRPFYVCSPVNVSTYLFASDVLSQKDVSGFPNASRLYPIGQVSM